VLLHNRNQCNKQADKPVDAGGSISKTGRFGVTGAATEFLLGNSRPMNERSISNDTDGDAAGKASAILDDNSIIASKNNSNNHHRDSTMNKSTVMTGTIVIAP
jgi:hypothetical protein